MYCTACGTQLRDTDRFCFNCGKATTEAAARWRYGSPKRLVRPMDQKVIGGVCAGFAQYLDVDVVLMRILWLCFAIFTGIGFIVYLICWIVMPRQQPLPGPSYAAPVSDASPAVNEAPPAPAAPTSSS